ATRNPEEPSRDAWGKGFDTARGGGRQSLLMNNHESASVDRNSTRPSEAPAAQAASTDPLELALAVLRCTRCTARDFAIEETALRCKRCSQSYRLEAGIVDALPSPSHDVVDELRGMMGEAKFEGGLDAFKIAKVAS